MRLQIIAPPETKPTTYAELEPGDIFAIRGDFPTLIPRMRTDSGYVTLNAGDTFNATYLQDGEKTSVIPLDATLSFVTK